MTSAGNQAAKCAALITLNTCVGTLLGSTSPAMLASPNGQTAISILTTAASAVGVCNALTVADIATTVEVDAQSVIFQSADANSVSACILIYHSPTDSPWQLPVFNTYTRDGFRIQEIVNNITIDAQTTNPAFASTLRSQISAATSTMSSATSQTASAIVGNVTPLASSVTSAITAANSTATLLYASATNDLPYRIPAALNSVMYAVDLEAEALQTAKQSYATAYDARINTLLNGFLDDAADQHTILATDSTYITGINNQISTTTSTFSTNEDARAVTVSTSLSTAISTLQSTMSPGVAVALSTEVSRATAIELSVAATIFFKMPTGTGSTDFQTW